MPPDFSTMVTVKPYRWSQEANVSPAILAPETRIFFCSMELFSCSECWWRCCWEGVSGALAGTARTVGAMGRAHRSVLAVRCAWQGARRAARVAGCPQCGHWTAQRGGTSRAAVPMVFGCCGSRCSGQGDDDFAADAAVGQSAMGLGDLRERVGLLDDRLQHAVVRHPGQLCQQAILGTAAKEADAAAAVHR